MGASGFTTMLFGFISVATFLYVSLLCHSAFIYV